MADTAVAITAGSGTNIDTRTEATNGNHRQVVVLGDPSTNAGVAAVDATNGLSVNVTNASLTVASHAVTNAGTFATQAAQSGTWTVQPGNTANTTAWKVDGSAVTQPVSGTVAVSSVSTSITPGTAAANLGKAEDAAHSDGDVGVMALAVRKNTAAATSGSDGDYNPVSVNTRGATWVAIEDGSGGQVTSFSGPTQYTEDAAAASDPVGSMLMAVRRDTLSTSEVSADGDNIALKASNKGKLHVAAETRFGDTVADTGSGTGGSATQRVIVDSSQLTTLATAAQAMATSGYQVVGLANDSPAIGAEDAPSSDGQTGMRMLVLRKDTPANGSGSDADYEFPQMSAGRMWTSTALPSGSVASGAFASGSIASGAVASGAVASGAFASGSIASGAIAAGAIAAGATSIADNEDAASNDGDRGVKILAVRKATPANTSGSDGDYEFLQISNGLLWTAPVGFATTCSTDITRPADTTAYTANDNWSDSTSSPTTGGFTLTSAARISGGSGIITDILITSSAVPGTLLQGELWIGDSALTAVNDNAAFALSDSDAKLIVAIVPFTLIANASNSYYHAQNLNIGFTAVGSANLRYLVKVKNAYTPISAEVLTVRAKIIQTN